MRVRTALAPVAAALALCLLAGATRAQEASPPPPSPPAPSPPADPPKKTPTLEEVKRSFDDYWPVYVKDYLAYHDMIAAEERDVMATRGKLEEAKKAAQAHPEDRGAKELADALEAEFKKAVEKHIARKPEYEKRSKAHYEKLNEIMQGLMDLCRKDPGGSAPQILRLKVLADFGATPDIVYEAANLFRKHPESRDVRLAFAQSQLAIPDDGREPKDPRHDPGRPPRFDKVYEALAPLTKAEPENESVQLMFGVAACALGKNDEAASALGAVAHFENVNPAIRILIGNPHDPGAAFAVWRDVAKGLAAKPDDLDLRRKRAMQLFQCRAMKDALPDALAFVQGRPKDPDGVRLLGSCFFAPHPCATSNSYELGVPGFLELSKQQPDEDVVHALAAAVLHHANRVAEARAEFDRVKRPAALVQDVRNEAQGVLAGNADEWAKEEKERALDEKRDNPRVLLETEKGRILLELFEDTAPNTVANFIDLVEKHYYDGIFFHRVLPGFMAQGGDPLANGSGGPGYCIPDEAQKNPRLHWRGSLSMAKTNQPDTGGSQFFLCYKPCEHLNHIHTVFGRVVEGQDSVDALEIGDRIKAATVVRKRTHPYSVQTIPPGKSWSPAPKTEGEKKDEKAPGKQDEKAPEKKDEKAPGKQDEKAPEKKDEKAPEKQDEKKDGDAPK